MRPFQSVYFVHSIADLILLLTIRFTAIYIFIFYEVPAPKKLMCFCEESQLTPEWTEMGQPGYSYVKNLLPCD